MHFHIARPFGASQRHPAQSPFRTAQLEIFAHAITHLVVAVRGDRLAAERGDELDRLPRSESRFELASPSLPPDTTMLETFRAVIRLPETALTAADAG